MATIGKIRVCVLEGHQAELASAGLPLSVCLRLQQLDLSMSAALWSTRLLSILLLAVFDMRWRQPKEVEE